MKNMQRMILAFLFLMAIVSILMLSRQTKAATMEAVCGVAVGSISTSIQPLHRQPGDAQMLLAHENDIGKRR